METALTVPARSGRRSGPGAGTRTMARMAKGRINAPMYFDPAAHPMSRPSRMARCGAGSCSNLISVAKEGRDEDILLEDAGMNDEERRRRGGRGRSQGRQSVQIEPRQREGGEHHDAAGECAENPGEFGQGWRVRRLHYKRRGLRQVDHEQRVIVVVPSGADASKLDDLVPRSAEWRVNQVERHHDRDHREQNAAKVAQGKRARIAIPAPLYRPRPDRLPTRFVQQWLLQSGRPSGLRTTRLGRKLRGPRLPSTGRLPIIATNET
jgi:hypothetical protein